MQCIIACYGLAYTQVAKRCRQVIIKNDHFLAKNRSKKAIINDLLFVTASLSLVINSDEKSRFLAPPIFGDFGNPVLCEENRKTRAEMVVKMAPKRGPKNAQKRDHVPRIH